MAFKLVPRGWETSSTTGTGALTLAGAVTNYPNTGDTWRAFGDDLSNNDTTYYAVVNRGTQTEWEEGIGTWGTGGILTRTTIIRSSNSNNAVNFTAGTLDVMCTPITSAAVPYNASANQLLLSGAGAVPTWSAKLSEGSAAGQGLIVAAGTAASAVSAMALTGTINFNTSAINWVDWTLTDTSSHASTNAFRIQGGASGTTKLLLVDKAGSISTSKNSGIAFWVDVSGQNPVGFSRNGTVGGLTVHGGDAATPSDSTGNTVFITTTAMRHASTVVAGWSASNISQAFDVTLSRQGPAVLQVGTTGAGSTGSIRAKFQSSDGTAGVASFGPSAVASITVKDGIITAIS